jgi:DNA polymerase I
LPSRAGDMSRMPSAKASPARQPVAKAPLKAGDHLILVDGSTFMFRAFFAIQTAQRMSRSSDGLPTGAVLVFCNMIWKLLQEGPTTEPGDEPTHFGVVFDYSAKTFRNEIYPEYKAHRPEPPSDLIPQFGLIRQATRAFSLPMIEQQGWEADDLIATYAVSAHKAGATVTIVASDKDLMQIVRPGITMVDTMKNQVIDREAVKEKFGVYPEKMIELQALVGDSTDNVPGVPGIGPKTAAQLLDEYGDLETLFLRAGEIRQPKRRENLQQFAEQARISRKLVELCCEVPLETPLDDLAVEPVDGAQAIGFCKAMEFHPLAKRIGDKTGTDPAEVAPVELTIEGWPPEGGLPAHGPDMGTPGRKRPPAGAPSPEEIKTHPAGGPPGALGTPADLVAVRLKSACEPKIDPAKYHTLRTVEELQRWAGGAREHGLVAIGVETTSPDAMQGELCGMSLALERGLACYIPVGHRTADGDMFGGGLAADQVPLDEALSALRPLLEDPAVLKIGQNIKSAWKVLARHGITMAPIDDTMLMSYALDASTSAQGHGLEGLCKRLLSHEPIEIKGITGTGKAGVTFDRVTIDKATSYAAETADTKLRIWSVLKPRLTAERLTRVYERLERPIVPVLARMERRGIKVDRQILSRLSGTFAQKAGAVESEIYELAGETFNIGSTKQLGDILFGKMQLPGGRKTRTGQWSTDVKMLEELAEEGVPIARKIVEWRQLTKLKSTYTDALPGYIHPDTGRVHTDYSLASTTTGRLSSSEPNLQNIPVRTEEGRAIRRAFIAEDGWKLVSADYSQIELRVLAHIADIPQLRKAFADGLDIHAMTASEMFSVPVEGMDPMVRRRAKAINFGIIYGISAFGLANQLGIERSEAADYINRYFERFPGIRDYMDSTKRFARDHLYVETLFGRRAHYPEIRSSQPNIRSFQERAAINAPIQGSAADIIRRAMIRMDNALEKAGLRARMLLQVHDELVFEVPDEEVEAAIPVIRRVMEGAAEPAIQLRVPLHVDARAADNWDEAH